MTDEGNPVTDEGNPVIDAVLHSLADDLHASLCGCRDYPESCKYGYDRWHMVATLSYAEAALEKALELGWKPPVPPREPEVFPDARSVPPFFEKRLVTSGGIVYGRYHPTNERWHRVLVDGSLSRNTFALAELPAEDWPLTEESTRATSDGA